MIAPIDADSLTGDTARRSALLALNNHNSAELSWLDEAGLIALLAECYVALAVDQADALLIAFHQGAAYDSPNFRWFAERYDSFVYIDRVVVAEHARRRGHAAALYRELFARARAFGHKRVVCEVNADPPNPVSDAFHARLGFAELGETLLASGKTVRYFGCML